MLCVKTIDMEHCSLEWINYFHGRTNKSKLGVMALHQSRYMWGHWLQFSIVQMKGYLCVHGWLSGIILIRIR